MPSAEYDLRYIQAGLSVLENFLMSGDVYWPIGASAPAGHPPYPQLTLGGVLLALARAQARVSDPEERARLADMQEKLDDIRSRWRVAWGKKAGKEFGARLNLWRNFLEDYRNDRENNSDRYNYEVRRRVQLQLLAPDVEDVSEAQMELLNGLDRLLQAMLAPSEFIWEEALKPSFPQDPFWYLYGVLPDK